MEWIMSLEKWAARDSLHFQEGDLEKFANSFTSDKEGNLWDGNWRELKYFYARAKSIALRRKGNHLIRKEDLDFASQWVLVDEYADDNEQLNLSFDKDEKNIIAEKPFDSNTEVEVRLDCILVIHYVLQKCKNKSAIGIDKIIDATDFTSLGLCNKALRLVAKEDLLKEAIKIAQEAGRITNPAIDMLMDKKGALKVWWRGNAAQTGFVIKNNVTKYKPILNIVEKLSPTRFYISNGCLEVKNNVY
jgi:hypothetical protein